MKKAAVMLMIMTVITSAVFFCDPVYAAYEPGVQGHKTDGWSTSGLNFYVTADELFATTDTSLTGGINQEIFVTVRIINNTNEVRLLPGLKVMLQFTNPAYIVSYTNLSKDLFFADVPDVTGYVNVAASPEYTYNNTIIVPPMQTMYLVGSVTVRNYFNTQDQSLTAPGLASVTLRHDTVGFDQVPYPGQPQDLSAVTDYLDDIAGYTDNLETYINSLRTFVNDIKTQITFTGTLTEYNPLSYTAYNYQNPNLYQNVYIYANWGRMGSYTLYDHTEITGPNSYYHSSTIAIPYTCSVRINNDNDYTVKTNQKYYRVPVVIRAEPGYSYVINDFKSDIFSSYYITYLDFNSVRYLIIQFYFGITDASYAYVPAGLSDTSFLLMCYKDDDFPDPVFESTPVDYSSPVFSKSDKQYSNNPLQDIWLGLSESDPIIDDKSDDVSDQAETIADQVENVHQQEMQYFQDNQDAIAATGLNNFQFNQNHISAFTMITTQFTELWNALSDYTLVFIFTLLLSLATYIIKHEPTTKVKQYRSSVAAERAERISYYSHKNAQARANNGARNDGDSYFWDAVRRNNS